MSTKKNDGQFVRIEEIRTTTCSDQTGNIPGKKGIEQRMKLVDAKKDYVGYLRAEQGATEATVTSYQSWLNRYERWLVVEGQSNVQNRNSACELVGSQVLWPEYENWGPTSEGYDLKGTVVDSNFIVQLFYRFSDRSATDGIGVGIFGQDKADVPVIRAKMEVALSLIRQCDPRRYAYLKRDVPRILVFGLPGYRGMWHQSIALCEHADKYVLASETTPAMVASTLISDQSRPT